MKVFSYYGENYIRYGKFEVRKAYTSLRIGKLSIYFGSVSKVNEVFSQIKNKLKQLSPEDSVILYEDRNTVISLPISAVKGFKSVLLSNGERIDTDTNVFWDNLLGYLKNLKVKEVAPLIGYNLGDILTTQEEIKGKLLNMEQYMRGEILGKIAKIEKELNDISIKLEQLKTLRSDLEALKNKEVSIEGIIKNLEETLDKIESMVQANSKAIEITKSTSTQKDSSIQKSSKNKNGTSEGSKMTK